MSIMFLDDDSMYSHKCLRWCLYECHVCNTAYMYLADLQNSICINTENIVPFGQHIIVHAVVLFCFHKYQNKYAAWTQVGLSDLCLVSI